MPEGSSGTARGWPKRGKARVGTPGDFLSGTGRSEGWGENVKEFLSPNKKKGIGTYIHSVQQKKRGRRGIPQNLEKGRAKGKLGEKALIRSKRSRTRLAMPGRSYAEKKKRGEKVSR